MKYEDLTSLAALSLGMQGSLTFQTAARFRIQSWHSPAEACEAIFVSCHIITFL